MAAGGYCHRYGTLDAISSGLYFDSWSPGLEVHFAFSLARRRRRRSTASRGRATAAPPRSCRAVVKERAAGQVANSATSSSDMFSA